jgi:hypothetical protein
MAVYKVPQDVEADDKLIGPFSFRQFVFFLVMVGFLYISYLLFTISPLMFFIPIPLIIFFAALAFPWRKDQPTEVYLTALIHFWIKPRKRIWNQEGHVEHVIITAPKKVDHQYTDGLTRYEVQSRLHNLASTLDSRGWAAKNVSAQDIPSVVSPQQQGGFDQSDRLAMPKVANPIQDQTVIVLPQEDVMDEVNNPVAQNFENLVNKASDQRRQELMEQMRAAASAPVSPAEEPTPDVNFNPYPSMQQNVVKPFSQADDSEDSDKIEEPAKPPTAPEASSAILNLANNSDLNVSTIARQAEQAMHSGDTIELH